MTQAAADTTDTTVLDDTTLAGAGTTQTTVDTPTVDDGAAATGSGETEDEVVVTIGEESPPSAEEDESRAPEWVRELRKSNREKDRRLRELEQENATLKGPGTKPAAVQVGEKPTLEGCNYDAARFETELEGWHARKREADDQQAQAQAAQKKQQEQWQTTLDGYGKAKAALKVKDFDEAEAIAKDTLSVVQQGIVLAGCDNPAVLVYALGRNPAKAKELAAITDPVKFSFAVAKLETQLKVTPRKSAPPPERQVRSSVAGAAAVDNVLERLRAEAAKTGDLSKVVAYNNQKRQQGGRG